MSPYEKIAIIGGGAWGTALAATVCSAGRNVVLWARENDVARSINEKHRNTVFLPGVDLDPKIKATDDMGKALSGADAVLVVAPSQFLRDVLIAMKSHLSATRAVCLCGKGIERNTGLLMSQVAADVLRDHPIAVLSGPSFAAEVARREPTLVTIASEDISSADKAEASIAARLARSLGTPWFRPYISNDVVGVEVGGAVKNVLAIACGIAAGLGFGSNTRAALITRGIEEIKTLAEALGGKRETVTGLSGVGDLTLTCSSEQSRNMSFGLSLGKGLTVEEALGDRPQVVEGMVNAVAVTDLAGKLGIEMPISEAVRAIVAEGSPIRDAIANLMGRPLKGEPKGLSVTLRPAFQNGVEDRAGVPTTGKG